MSDEHLLAMFRDELESAVPRLQDIVLLIEAGTAGRDAGQEAMRFTHALKGAARIVGAPKLAGALHAAEDVLGRSARGEALDHDDVQRLLALIDALEEASLLAPAELGRWLTTGEVRHGAMEVALRKTPPPPETIVVGGRRREITAEPMVTTADRPSELTTVQTRDDMRAVRVPADSLSRLLGAAGAVVVEARRLGASNRDAYQLQRVQSRIETQTVELARRASRSNDPQLVSLAKAIIDQLDGAHALASALQQSTSDSVLRLNDASEHLFLEALRVRQRPFAELVPALRRHVRETARALGKSVRLDLEGTTALVDGDVLAGLEMVLGHLVTNAIDHGIEPEAERRKRNKSPQGVISIAVMRDRADLLVRVSDDGGGIDPERVRKGAIERRMVDEAAAFALQRTELLELLFMPGFSLAATLSVHSGRGVGLDAVRAMLRQVGGHVAIDSELGQGTRFELTVPVSRVVVRALVVSVAREAYAMPLSKIGGVVRVPTSEVKVAEGREYVTLDGKNVGLVRADEVFDVFAERPGATELTLVLLHSESATYALVVDAALGEDDLVAQPLDPRMGHVQNVAAGALLADGSPTLVLDVDDVLASIERLTRRRRPRAVVTSPVLMPRRVLVTDDSPVVREMLRTVLTTNGYHVTVAPDGVAALELLKNTEFDLLIVDLEMPRLGGIGLLQTINAERAREGLAGQPAIIVSYLDDDARRREGLAAGAEHFLSKNDFDDRKLMELVRGLIG